MNIGSMFNKNFHNLFKTFLNSNVKSSHSILKTKRKLFKKKEQKQNKDHTTHSITIRERERKEREREIEFLKKPSCIWIGNWYQVWIVCFCFQEEELWQLLHLHSQHLQKVSLFLCLDILHHPSSYFFCVIHREREREKRREEKRREEKRREDKRREFFLGFEQKCQKKERNKKGERERVGSGLFLFILSEGMKKKPLFVSFCSKILSLFLLSPFFSPRSFTLFSNPRKNLFSSLLFSLSLTYTQK